jgi:hypothetical protein
MQDKPGGNARGPLVPALIPENIAISVNSHCIQSLSVLLKRLLGIKTKLIFLQK